MMNDIHFKLLESVNMQELFYGLKMQLYEVDQKQKKK